MSFSPVLYISNGFIFYFSIYTSIIAAATIFDLASVAQPRPAVELVSAALPSSSTPARPRHPPGPHHASSLRRIPSPPPHPSPPSVADRFPPGLVIEPRPASVELVCRAAPSSSLARPRQSAHIDLAVSAVRRPRARCSARPRGQPARPARPARAIRPSLLASCMLSAIYMLD